MHLLPFAHRFALSGRLALPRTKTESAPLPPPCTPKTPASVRVGCSSFGDLRTGLCPPPPPVAVTPPTPLRASHVRLSKACANTLLLSASTEQAAAGTRCHTSPPRPAHTSHSFPRSVIAIVPRKALSTFHGFVAGGPYTMHSMPLAAAAHTCSQALPHAS
jgi:hypothetical protein